MGRNYVEQHAKSFEDGDVEGIIDEEVCGERSIAVQGAMNLIVTPTSVSRAAEQVESATTHHCQ